MKHLALPARFPLKTVDKILSILSTKANMKASTVLSTTLLTGIAIAQDLYPGLSNLNHTCVISAS